MTVPRPASEHAREKSLDARLLSDADDLLVRMGALDQARAVRDAASALAVVEKERDEAESRAEFLSEQLERQTTNAGIFLLERDHYRAAVERIYQHGRGPHVAIARDALDNPPALAVPSSEPAKEQA